MLDAGGRGVVPRQEILSVTLRFARHVETRVLREFRRDLRAERRRRRHALSSAARDAAERAVLGEMDEGEDDTTTTTTTSHGYGSSWDSDDSYDDSDDSSGTSADDRTEAHTSEGVGWRRGDGSTTDAGSEADEKALRLERERRISVVVKGVAQTCVREEHDARFHAPAHAAYRPAGTSARTFF